jgi:cysteine desulfurase / selenocysteine lyase
MSPSGALGGRYNTRVPAEKRTYMDHAATSFPKPPGVLEAIERYMTCMGASPGRGAYAESLEAGQLLLECRARLRSLINGERDEHIVFTLNCSDALNIAIKGVVRPGDHVITTALDHNSILRPFNQLVRDRGVSQTRLECDPRTGLADPDDLRRAIRPNTRLIAALHGSNVTGTLQPIEAFGRIAREHDAIFLVDAAQTLGHVPMDVQRLNIDLLAAPGHKGLLGPLGTGLLYIRPGIERVMTTLREGGTGSLSEHDTQPDFLPDRFEPGSHNMPGIAGLSESVRWILERGVPALWRHEQQLMEAFLAIVRGQEATGLRLYGPCTVANRCAVFSVRMEGADDPLALSAALEREYGVLTRSGLHCAPGAHATIGTADSGGTTRLSFGAFTTLEDVGHAASALAELSRRCAAAGV